MRRAQRIKLLAIAATSACIALHVTRCGCCGLCGQPAAVASTVVPQQLPSLPGGEPATMRVRDEHQQEFFLCSAFECAEWADPAEQHDISAADWEPFVFPPSPTKAPRLEAPDQEFEAGDDEEGEGWDEDDEEQEGEENEEWYDGEEWDEEDAEEV